MQKPKIATVWLDGCSGCHMSLLDMDERIIEVLDKIELVYSPLVSTKTFPLDVDVVFVEGAVSSNEDEEFIAHIRKHSKILVSFGDCAVTSNIPGMRNNFALDELIHRAYVENADINDKAPKDNIPRLNARSKPLHEFVPVDVFLPGCPPPADVIYHVITELIAGRIPDLTGLTRFGK